MFNVTGNFHKALFTGMFKVTFATGMFQSDFQKGLLIWTFKRDIQEGYPKWKFREQPCMDIKDSTFSVYITKMQELPKLNRF
jgi:hypothetical protein